MKLEGFKCPMCFMPWGHLAGNKRMRIVGDERSKVPRCGVIILGSSRVRRRSQKRSQIALKTCWCLGECGSASLEWMDVYLCAAFPREFLLSAGGGGRDASNSTLIPQKMPLVSPFRRKIRRSRGYSQRDNNQAMHHIRSTKVERHACCSARSKSKETKIAVLQ